MPDAFTELDNRAVFDRFHAAIASGIVVLFIDIRRLVVISFHLLEGRKMSKLVVGRFAEKRDMK